MKLPALLAASALLILTAVAADSPDFAGLVAKLGTPPAPDATAPGRFQLILNGPYLYRIDTATGRVWELETLRLTNGNTLTAWSPVNESMVAVRMLGNALNPQSTNAPFKPFSIEEAFKTPPRAPTDFTKPAK